MEDPGFIPGTLFFLLLLAGGYVFVAGSAEDRREGPAHAKLFVVAYLLRFALSVGIYQFGLVSVFGDEDASGWWTGVGMKANWDRQGMNIFLLPYAMAGAFEGHHKGYSYLLGAVFFLTNSPFRLVAAALNGFFGAMTVVYTYRIARSLFSPWVAHWVGLWTTWFPSMLIWSALTVKEPVVIFLETLAMWGCVRVRRHGLSIPHLALCGVTIVLLIPFRFYAAYIVFAAVLVALVAPEVLRPQRARPGMVLAVLLGAVIIGTSTFARRERELETMNLDRVQNFRQDVATGGAKYGARTGVNTGVDVRTPSGFAMGAGIGAAHLLLAPFPWQLGGGSSLRMILSLPELMYWWWLVFVGLYPGIRLCISKRLNDVLVLLLFILGFGLLYSVMFGNVGLVFRQRAQLLPWLFIFAAVGLESRALAKLKLKQAREALAAPPAGAAPAGAAR